VLALCGALVVVSAGAATGSKTFSGTTSERGPVSFKVVGKHVVAFSASLGYNGNCGQGGGPGYTIKVASIKVASGGRFSATTTGVGPVASVPSVRIRVAGRIKARHATGSVLEPKHFCAAPNQTKLSYAETFTASAVSG
jgi:hypothetical protein